MSYSTAKRLFEDLTGQTAPLEVNAEARDSLTRFGRGQISVGYSQFNEILLLLGFDRVSHAFFQYLVDGKTDYAPGSSINSLREFRESVRRFQILAILIFGNIKFAFKKFSRDRNELEKWIGRLQQVPDVRFTSRNRPILPVAEIPGEQTYLLGYVVADRLRADLKKNPRSPALRALSKRREAVVNLGIRNHDAYLASDHLDVYVATSMRERHEYLEVNETVREIFKDPDLQRLCLRWFDPTQAYCLDRIDKGLAEGLMLKRAKCTVYFAQESDTLGKDSELATTLAQGKVVIAYVPRGDKAYVDRLLRRLGETSPEASEIDNVLRQLQVFDPQAAWKDRAVRLWLERRSEADVSKAKARLYRAVREHYERRARILRDTHPLGIQVNLYTGVTNGVLVVRSVRECAELIRQAVTHSMQFSLRERRIGEDVYKLLIESVSGCVYRAVTGNSMLTNAFWNFYLRPSE